MHEPWTRLFNRTVDTPISVLVRYDESFSRKTEKTFNYLNVNTLVSPGIMIYTTSCLLMTHHDHSLFMFKRPNTHAL